MRHCFVAYSFRYWLASSDRQRSIILAMMSPLDRKVGECAAICPLAEQEGQLVRLGSGSRVAMDAAAVLADMVNDAVTLLCLGQRGVHGIRLGVARDVDGLAHSCAPYDVCTLRWKIHMRDNFQAIVL